MTSPPPAPHAKARTERSAGVVIYTMQGPRRLYLLLRYAAGHWDLAKGKKEKGESDMQTALREVKEETGITDLRIEEGFAKSIEYRFVEEGEEKSSGVQIHKTVIFFLGKTKRTEIRLSDEHQDHAWQEYGDAVKTVTYAAAAGVLKAADAWHENGCAAANPGA